jgi:hypothetical protein
MQSLKNQGLSPYQGKAGGNYSGRNPANLNQLFKLVPTFEDRNVQSVQLEIIRELRSTTKLARMTGDCIANAIEDTVEFRQKLLTGLPQPKPQSNWPEI